jgi:hypothetical protein
MDIAGGITHHIFSSKRKKENNANSITQPFASAQKPK